MSEKVWEILKEFGETDRSNVWQVQSATVIKHACLERVAAKAGIVFNPPTILRADRDEAVILVTGIRDKRSEWSIGEALVGVNYRVTGKMAAYVYAMAEKRAKDRVILKLINLHGLAYSEDEADDFASRPTAAPPQAADNLPSADSPPNVGALLHGILLQEDVDGLKAWAAEHKAGIGRLPEDAAAKVRQAYANRVKALAGERAAV